MKPRTTYELDNNDYGRDPLFAKDSKAAIVQFRLSFNDHVSEETHEKISTMIGELQVIIDDANGQNRNTDEPVEYPIEG